MNVLHNFLGIPRWKALGEAIKRETSNNKLPELGVMAVLIALVVSLTPVALTFLDGLSPESVTTLPTVAFGICAILALLIRSAYGITFNQSGSWKENLSLTHTAIALGCVPAVLVILFSPELLTQRHDILAVPMRAATEAQKPTLSLILQTAGLVIGIAAWVAVTEELIFRGLLVSLLRRANLFAKQRHRDVFACFVSAVVFGLAHYPTWGLAASIALVGLGLGFVLAYIANGERLLPLIAYHFVFDLLSISLTLFL